MDDRLKSFLISSIIVIIIAITAILIFVSTEAEDSKFQDASVASIDITTLEYPIFVISVPSSNIVAEQTFNADIKVVFPEKEETNPGLNVAQVRINFDPMYFEVIDIKSQNNYQLLGEIIDSTTGEIQFDITNPLTFTNGSSLASIQLRTKSNLTTNQVTSINIDTQNSSIGLPNLYKNTIATAVFNLNSQTQLIKFGDSCVSDENCTDVSNTVKVVCNENNICANSSCPNDTIPGNEGLCNHPINPPILNCIKLGKVSPTGVGSCCEGSVAVAQKELINGVCMDSRDSSSFVCLSLDDGICGIGESSCNSPTDCNQRTSQTCPEKPVCLADEKLVELTSTNDKNCTNYICVKADRSEIPSCPEIKECASGYKQVEVSKDSQGCSSYTCEKICEETIVSCPRGSVLSNIGNDELGCPINQCVPTDICTPLPPCVYGINLGSSGVFTCDNEDLPLDTNWCPESTIEVDMYRDCKLDSNKDGQIDQVDFEAFSKNYNKELSDCALDIVGNDCKYDKSELNILGKMYEVVDICLMESTLANSQTELIRAKFEETNYIKVKIKLNVPEYLDNIPNNIDRYSLALKYLEKESKNYVANSFVVNPQIDINDFSITAILPKDNFDSFIKAKGSKIASLIFISNSRILFN